MAIKLTGKVIIASFAALIFSVAVILFSLEARSMTTKSETYSTAKPQMDIDAPEVIEQATFALG